MSDKEEDRFLFDTFNSGFTIYSVRTKQSKLKSKLKLNSDAYFKAESIRYDFNDEDQVNVKPKILRRNANY